MKKILDLIDKSIKWVSKRSIFQKFIFIILFTIGNQVNGQYIKISTSYDAENTAKHIMMGHIKNYLNDSLTEVVVEKKKDRWVTSYLNKDQVYSKVWKLLQKGKSSFSGSTNGGYRFYITVWDIKDEDKILGSIDITVDAFTQEIKLIELKKD